MNDPRDCFFNKDNLSQGIARKLAEGMSTRVFAGDQAMISIVRLEPDAKGTSHYHDEEQWGYLIEGSGTRVQDGQRFPVSAGDFWRTPGNAPHTFEAGPDGAVIFDVFAPPREAYLKPGEGFGG